MTRHTAAVVVILLVGASLQAGTFRLNAGPTGSVAEVIAPVVADEGLAAVELFEPGDITKSNTLYRLTKDVTAPGTAFTFGAGVKNVVLDLGGHVVTYNTVKKTPEAGKPYPYNEAVYGISFVGRGIGDIVIRNGIILQGAGGNAGSNAINLAGAARVELHGLQIRVHGPATANICALWGGPEGRIHDNYLENRSTTSADGILLSQAAPGWDIYNNTVIGAHRSIAVWNNATRNNQFSKARIHHNLLSPKRVHGVKAPQGIICFGSAGNEIFENEISTDDSRGINLQGRGSGHNHVHHNLIACRYSTKATEGNYVENRCYGYWERDGVANRLVDNVWIVGNEVEGDRTSNTVGIVATTTGGRLPSAEYARNRIICTHKDAGCDVVGIAIKQSDKDVAASGNEIAARTMALQVFSKSTGVQLSGNTLFIPKGVEKAAALIGGEDADKCVEKDNTVVTFNPDKAPPAAPAGLLAITRHEAVELRWNPNPEKDTVGYNVYCDGKKLNPFTVGGRFFVHLDVKPGETHRYEVSAVSLAGVESAKSVPLTVVQR